MLTEYEVGLADGQMEVIPETANITPFH